MRKYISFVSEIKVEDYTTDTGLTITSYTSCLKISGSSLVEPMTWSTFVVPRSTEGILTLYRKNRIARAVEHDAEEWYQKLSDKISLVNNAYSIVDFQGWARDYDQYNPDRPDNPVWYILKQFKYCEPGFDVPVDRYIPYVKSLLASTMKETREGLTE